MIKIKKYQIESYISDATQDALNLKADLVDGKVPSSQLPSYVDDVIEVPNYASLPSPGATGIIYVTLNNNKVYRWGGTDYIEIAFGVANLSYTPGVSIGVVNSDTGTDATIPLANTTNAGLFSAAEKTKLEGIATGANVGVVPNNPITGATKTKITYDSKGLVTSGADATTADIADSTDKRYVTDAQKTVINNTSGTNTGDQNIQQVLDKGNTTDTGIVINSQNETGVLINLSAESTGLVVSTVAGDELSYPILLNNDVVIYFQVDNGGNLISLGSLEAKSIKKTDGLSTQYLMADGSVTTGGGGDTDLGYTPSPTNGIVTSSTGTDATIPLADATNAGLLTPSEKTKISNSVPYTGATANVNLGEFGLLAGNIQLDNTPTNIPTAAGSIYWNDTDGTADLIMKGGNVKLQIGQESVIRVVNKTATNITLLESNYQAVRLTGAQGQRLKVDLAQATSDVLSAETIGLVTETIANNQEGFVTTSGLVRSINTTGSLQGETWADGDILYLSPTVAGRITKIKPSAPNHLIIIGYVVHAHENNGIIFVKVDNGYELDELHNVKITSPQFNGEVLQYNGITSVWENKNLLVGDADFGNDNNTYNSTLLSTLFDSKQETLVSGTNIKTINGSSVLGSGNLVVTGSPAAQGAYTILANNTNSSAVPTEKVYKEVAEQSLSGTGMSATGGTLPSGTQTHSYRWSQVGNLVTVRINLQFSTPGTCSGIAIPFANLSDVPQTPQHPSIYSATGDVITFGSGSLASGKSFPIFTVANGTSAIRKALTGSTYEFLVGRASGSYTNAWIQIQYYI